MSTKPPYRPSRTLRQRVGRTRRYAGYAPLLATPRPCAAYVGWVGEGNLGDAAMFEALRDRLAGVRLVPMPNLGDNRVLRLLARDGGLPVDLVVLGGGTLLGNGAFRTTLRPVMSHAAPEVPVVALGTGVEDPAFHGRRHRTDSRELRFWSKLLPRFDVLSVRGPCSAEVLADLGFDPVVVGDPALSLVRRGDTYDVEPGLIGLNVGVADDLWGNDGDAVVDRIVALGRRLVAGGHRIVAVSTWTGDDGVAREVAARIGPGATATGASIGVDRVVRTIGRCEVVVAEKLHAGIFAAVAGVPCLPIEYQPKVLDFQASIGREDRCVRSDEVATSDLEGMVESLLAERVAESTSVRAAVLELVERQERCAAAVRDRLAGVQAVPV